MNVADQLTKWGKNLEIDPNSAWIRDHPFLYKSEEEWPTDELRVHLLLYDIRFQ